MPLLPECPIMFAEFDIEVLPLNEGTSLPYGHAIPYLTHLPRKGELLLEF